MNNSKKITSRVQAAPDQRILRDSKDNAATMPTAKFRPDPVTVAVPLGTPHTWLELCSLNKHLDPPTLAATVNRVVDEGHILSHVPGTCILNPLWTPNDPVLRKDSDAPALVLLFFVVF
ncbi:hypothetical protein ACEPPN_015983 [Leptodophora sp. 'Broadleaf-Isolate-01']